MEADPAEAADERVRDLVRGGAPGEGATLALKTYGAEIYGFLVGVTDDAQAATGLYADVCQRVTTELEAFGWTIALRTWLYAISRRELHDVRLRRRRRPERRSSFPEGVHETDSSRPAGLTGAIAAVRKTLSEEERELLILRIDRGLEWEEIARTSLGEGGAPEDLVAETFAVRGRVGELLARVERMTAEHLRSR